MGVCVVYGTRPEFIKVAPLVDALRELDVPVDLVFTGQHRGLIDRLHDESGRAPDVVLSAAPTAVLTDAVAGLIRTVGAHLREARPAVVLVQGDTTTAIAAALAGFYERIPVVHLEAGLRSGSLAAPFPEEANRKLVAAVTALHLAPTTRARANLIGEGIDADRIVVTGNTVVDALRSMAGDDAGLDAEPRAGDAGGEPRRRNIVLTLHRRESWGEASEQFLQALRAVATGRDDLCFLVPVHPGPAIRQAVHRLLGGVPNIELCEPLGHRDFLRIMRAADVIVTDSGGVQEEAAALGKRLLVVRDAVDRPESIDGVHSVVIGARGEGFAGHLEAVLAVPSPAPSRVYGDGDAAIRAATAIVDRFPELRRPRPPG